LRYRSILKMNNLNDEDIVIAHLSKRLSEEDRKILELLKYAGNRLQFIQLCFLKNQGESSGEVYKEKNIRVKRRD
jgi:hypothetical protein